MARDGSAWRAGSAAWKRLTGWQREGESHSFKPFGNGDSAVRALADIGLVRHLLDQAELIAVRNARRHGKSWTEVATNLGVTRQSAWERWHDLDDHDVTPAGTSGYQPETVRAIEAAAADDLVAERLREIRRRSTVTVPNLVRMYWDDARTALIDKGLVAIASDPDGPPLAALGWPNAVVTAQAPESGARVLRGSPVTLWLEKGDGSAGVREPRRPRPSPKSGLAARPDPGDEAAI